MRNLNERILPDLYRTALHSDHWSAVLDTLCMELDVVSAVAQQVERDGHHLCERWSARDTRSAALAAWHDATINNSANPRMDMRLVTEPRDGEVARDEDRFEPGSAALSALRQRLAAAGLGRSLALFLRVRPNTIFSVILHRRPDDAREFSGWDETVLRQLAPHLRQAVAMGDEARLLRDTDAARRQVIDLVATAVILCAADGAVEWINAQARAILERPGALQVRHGRLCCADTGFARIFDRLAARPGERRRLTVLEAGGSPLQIAACRLDDGRQALFLSEPDRPSAIDAGDVAALFALSPAEARLASGLGGGLSLAQCAASRGVTLGTARIQLKQVLAKTRARRQVELVRQIGRSIVGQVRPLSQMGD